MAMMGMGMTIKKANDDVAIDTDDHDDVDDSDIARMIESCVPLDSLVPPPLTVSCGVGLRVRAGLRADDDAAEGGGREGDRTHV